MEPITKFRNRVNHYNKTHHLETGKVEKLDDNSCLYCNKYEEGHDDDVDYICSNCCIGLLNTTMERKQEIHNRSEKLNYSKQMEALEMFSGITSNNKEKLNGKLSKRSRRARRVRG